MPKLKVLVGPTPNDLTPITSLVNTNTPHRVVSDAWEGEILVFIKGFNEADPSKTTSAAADYFGRDNRSGVTWSIQVQGRFLSPRSSDDIMFGNIFERPLKLPWGTGAALKFMKIIDPTLSHDLTCQATQKPWALSPLVATMPYLKHTRISSPSNSSADSLDSSSSQPPFPPPNSVTDDTSSLHLCATPPSSSSSDSSSLSSRSSGSQWGLDSKKSRRKANGNNVPRSMSSQQRRSHFSSEANRKNVVLGPQDVITTDFCYGFLEFSPSLRLRLPVGLSFDLARYWDGQGVRFVCCERKQTCSFEPNLDETSSLEEQDGEHPPGNGNDDSEDPWGRVFWCVSIEMDEDEQD
ncbi:hypothetical protein R3P38DRAFT_2841269 [Favolaschia claudopus]|uniref:Domain of unknown function at the cortex 1 domain-containing protein n=1 Tax=Favolaschia claudopus TaxID=2862362 RepID=A0AAW0E3C0_9AGAR